MARYPFTALGTIAPLPRLHRKSAPPPHCQGRGRPVNVSIILAWGWPACQAPPLRRAFAQAWVTSRCGSPAASPARKRLATIEDPRPCRNGHGRSTCYATVALAAPATGPQASGWHSRAEQQPGRAQTRPSVGTRWQLCGIRPARHIRNASPSLCQDRTRSRPPRLTPCACIRIMAQY